MSIKPALLLYCAIALTPLASAADSAVEVSGPADPSVRVPETTYESAFGGYRPYREERLTPWRDVNEEVRRAGGHIGIMRTGAGGTRGDAAPEAAGDPSSGQSSAAPMKGAPGAPTAPSTPHMPRHSGH